MWFLYIGLVLLASKLLEFGPLAELSWWWVVLPFVLALIWFEIVEARLGLDKKKAFNELEKAKKERIARSLQRDDLRRSGRR
jgi:small Trp-rich protein